jgi:hypothetical protein
MADQADIAKIAALLQKEETEADDVSAIAQLLGANPSLAQATPDIEGRGCVCACIAAACPARLHYDVVAHFSLQPAEPVDCVNKHETERIRCLE